MHFKIFIGIGAQVQRVWNILTDLSRLREWLPYEVEINLPRGPRAAAGVPIELSRRTLLGELSIQQKIERCDRRALQFALRHERELLSGRPLEFFRDVRIAFGLARESRSATQVIVRTEWTPVGLAATLSSSLAQTFIQSEFQRGLANLKRLCESERRVPTSRTKVRATRAKQVRRTVRRQPAKPANKVWRRRSVVAK